MPCAHPAPSPKLRIAAASRRDGRALWWVLAAVVVVSVAATVGMTFLGEKQQAVIVDPAMLHVVKHEPFRNAVAETGEMESSENYEVRCEVKARNSSGTKILWIIDNGKEVAVNEKLIVFDSSALEDERNLQQTVVNNSKATTIQARATLETASITKQEYLEGTYQQDEQAVQSEVFVAEENLRRAQEYERYSQKLAAKGYVTALQLEADRFAVEKARKDLQAANTKLNVLRNYTKRKSMTQLEADVETATAKLASEENTLKINQDKLALLERLVAKCTVTSEHAGKVQYANQRGDRGGSEFIVEEGAVVREGQIVLRIPNMQKMQAVAKIHEARVKMVKPGMKASLTADALKGIKIAGTVQRIDEFPLSQNMYFSPSYRQYAAYIVVDDPNTPVKPGMNVKVEIEVDARPDVITVPIQAVVERDGHYCVVYDNSGPRAVPVAVGAANLSQVEIVAGLTADQIVITNSNSYIDGLDRPKPSAEVLAAREQQLKLRGGRGDRRMAKGPPAGGPGPTLDGTNHGSGGSN